jgi:hypothetical protein
MNGDSPSLPLTPPRYLPDAEKTPFSTKTSAASWTDENCSSEGLAGDLALPKMRELLALPLE